MTFPKRWMPGDRITAERLNVDQVEALRARNQKNLGTGSSLVGELMGNQSDHRTSPRTALVIAKEDFRIPGTATDLYAVQDDVPSGKCTQVRLNRKTGLHEVETVPAEFRVYDVIAGMTGTDTKSEDDKFYAIFNEDSHRWEVLSGGAQFEIVTAIVVSCMNHGWHEVQLCDWDGVPDRDQVFSNSASQPEGCDLCVEVDQNDAECDTVQEVVVFRPDCRTDLDDDNAETTGAIVYAHTTNLRPMLIGGMIKIAKRRRLGSGDSFSISVSLSSSDEDFEDKLYDVIDGVWELASLPFPTYECCTDPETGAQTVQLTGCTHVIVEGIICAGPENPCAVGSGSA